MKARKGIVPDPIRLFATQAAWADWLEKNHRKSRGIWLRLAKKGSRLQSITLEVMGGGGRNRAIIETWPSYSAREPC